MVDANASVEGEWGAEIVDSLSHQEGDVIVEGKRGLDTFATTNLDFILRPRITTIAIEADGSTAATIARRVRTLPSRL